MEHGVTGLVVPSGDEAAFGRALIGLHGDPARREALGTAARRRMQERYSTARMVREYLAVYEQHDSPVCRQRLQEQLTRLTGPAPQAQKGGL